jgi:hypothetical protein
MVLAAVFSFGVVFAAVIFRFRVIADLVVVMPMFFCFSDLKCDQTE